MNRMTVRGRSLSVAVSCSARAHGCSVEAHLDARMPARMPAPGVSTFLAENCGRTDSLCYRGKPEGRERVAHGASRVERRKPWGSTQASGSPGQGRKRMPHTFASLLVHVVFSTKNRAPDLPPELTGRLFPYMGGIVK